MAIAVMLLYHWTTDMDDIHFLQQRTFQAWNVRDAEVGIQDIKEHLLFLHAFTGCDSTSATFGKGKVSVVKLFRKSKQLQNVSNTFMDVRSTPDEIGRASTTGFMSLYGSPTGKSLEKIRYQKYLDMSCRGVIQPEKLPPTERACYFHGLRVFLQIMEWKITDEYDSKIDFSHWGWMKSGNTITPITTDLEYAPQELRYVIRCNCKSARPCSSNICSCRRHGIPCLPSCGECRGEDCLNSAVAFDKDRGLSDGSDEEGD